MLQHSEHGFHIPAELERIESLGLDQFEQGFLGEELKVYYVERSELRRRTRMT